MGYNTFIHYPKYELKKKLKEKGIRHKYQDKICEGVKAFFEDSIDDFINQAIENVMKIEGNASLINFFENDRKLSDWTHAK